MKLDLITDLPKLEQVEIDGVRHYTAEGVGPYPSVTTVLGADPKKKEGLNKWRERVGEEEANRVSHVAAQRGTAVHQIMEDYILDQAPVTKPMPIHLGDCKNSRSGWTSMWVMSSWSRGSCSLTT